MEDMDKYLNIHQLVVEKAAGYLRAHFLKLFKEVKEIEWKNTAQSASQLTSGVLKNFHNEISQKGIKVQKLQLDSGNINSWDLFLLVEVIKILQNKVGSKNKSFPQLPVKKLDDLKAVRYELIQPDKFFQIISEYEKYQTNLNEALKALGMSDEELHKEHKYPDYFATSEGDQKAEKIKQEANECYKAKKYLKALVMYNEGAFVQGVSSKTLGIIQSNTSLLFKLTDKIANAKDSAKRTITLRPTWFKGYMRLAEIYELQQNYEKALLNYRIANKLNPECKTTQKSMKFCYSVVGDILEKKEASSASKSSCNSTREVVWNSLVFNENSQYKQMRLLHRNALQMARMPIESPFVATNIHFKLDAEKPIVYPESFKNFKPITLSEIYQANSPAQTFMNRTLQVMVVEDALIGLFTSIHLLAVDENGDVVRISISIEDYPHSPELQGVLGFGCVLSIVNPFYKLCLDGLFAIKVEHRKGFFWHSQLRNVNRCRYCWKQDVSFKCHCCRHAKYCSSACANKDAQELQHFPVR